MKKILLVLISVIAVFSFAFAETFKDVPINHWAYEAVEKVTSMGILQGYPDGTFKGSDNVNRYALVLTVFRTTEYVKSNMIEPLEKKINTLEKLLQGIQVPSSANTGKDSSEEISNLKITINTMNNRIKNIEDTVNSLKSTGTNSGSVNSAALAKYDKDIKDLKSGIDELQSSYELLTYTVAKLKELEAKVNTMTPGTPSNNANTSNPAIDQKLSALIETDASLLAQIQDLKKNSDQRKKDIDWLASRTATLEKNFAALQTGASGADLAKITAILDNKADKSALDSKATKDDLKDISTKVDADSKKIADLTTSLEQVKQDAAKAQQTGTTQQINMIDILISVAVATSISLIIYTVMK